MPSDKKEIKKKFNYKGRKIILSLQYKKRDLINIPEQSKTFEFRFFTQHALSQDLSKFESVMLSPKEMILIFDKIMTPIFDIYVSNRPELFILDKKITFVLDDIPLLQHDFFESNISRSVIKIPFFYFLHMVNYFFLYKRLHKQHITDFLHELDHSVDLKMSRFLKRFDSLIQNSSDFNPYSVFLEIIIMSLRAEGYTKLLEEVNEKEIFLGCTLPYIKEFKEDLIKLVTATELTEEKLIGFFEQIVSLGSIHEMAQAMSLTIALSDYLKIVKKPLVKLKRGNKIYDLSELDKILKKHRSLDICGLPKRILSYSAKKIKRMYPKEFIRRYEKACKTLGISKDLMIMSESDYKQLRRLAKLSFEKK